MLFTSEQVAAGHPDKICDQISDVILSNCLSHDPNSRVAVETLIKDNHVTVAGEITSQYDPDVHELVRRVLAAREESIKDSLDLTVHISKQSADIAMGVDRKGAGDQDTVVISVLCPHRIIGAILHSSSSCFFIQS